MIPTRNGEMDDIDLIFWGIYRVVGRHGEQLRKIPKAMGIYTVQSVAQDCSQMFGDLVALVCKQSRSSKPLAMRRLLSMKIWAKI
jgi:hypothetical protein